MSSKISDSSKKKKFGYLHKVASLVLTYKPLNPKKTRRHPKKTASIPVVTSDGKILKPGVFTVTSPILTNNIDFGHIIKTLNTKVTDALSDQDKRLFNTAKIVTEDYSTRYDS